MADSEFTPEELQAEIWKVIPSWEHYAVSNLGRVRREIDGINTYAGRILTPILNNHGYFQYSLYSPEKSQRIRGHILVMRAFIGPQHTDTEVNHIDGDKTNNRLTNLEYTNRLHNQRHAARLGLLSHGANHYAKTRPELLSRGDAHYSRRHPEKLARGDQSGSRKHPERVARGERQHSAKLTEDKIRYIRHALMKGIRASVVARQLGVSQTTISYIKKGKTWRHVI